MTQGERINQVRKSLGLTLEKFGDKLGVTKTAISRIEKGERGCTEQMVKSICREFNVSENWLRDGIGDVFVIPEDEIATLLSDVLEEPDDEFYTMMLHFIKAYQTLRPESKVVLRELAHTFLESTKKRKE